MTTFTVGDPVLAWSEINGVVIEIDFASDFAPYGVRGTDRKALHWMGAKDLEHIGSDPDAERNLNDLIADLTAKGMAVTFIPSISGIGCEVKDYDPDEDSYYGDGIGLSPSMALDAALTNGGAW